MWTRHLAPIGLTILGLVLGSLVGRLSWEVFANPPGGFGFGSEFEGYDWVIGFASVGALVGAVVGTWIAARRMRARTQRSRLEIATPFLRVKPADERAAV